MFQIILKAKSPTQPNNWTIKKKIGTSLILRFVKKIKKKCRQNHLNAYYDDYQKKKKKKSGDKNKTSKDLV